MSHVSGPSSIRRVASCLAGVVSGVVLSLALAGPASASSVGCTGGGEGVDQVCLNIDNPRGEEGLEIERFQVRHDDLGSVLGLPVSPEQICNYHATLTIDPPGAGNAYVRESSRHEGCSWGVAWMDFTGGTYPDGTKACGRFYENGEQQGGAPCNVIHD